MKHKDTVSNKKPEFKTENGFFTKEQFYSDLKKATRRIRDDQSARPHGKPEKAK